MRVGRGELGRKERTFFLLEENGQQRVEKEQEARLEGRPIRYGHIIFLVSISLHYFAPFSVDFF